MKLQQKRRIILFLILAAAATQMLFGGLPGQLAALLSGEDMAAFLLYVSTGRLVQTLAEEPVAESTAPTEAATEATRAPEGALFLAEDVARIDVHSETAYAPNLEALLLQPLQWQLVSDQPTVLILHTHTTEAYAQRQEDPYVPSSQDRTLDKQHNMIRVGEYLAQLLEQQGIHVLHDTTLHDYPSYTGSYANARKTIGSYLERYPSIRLILDLHRDAVELEDGNQLTTHIRIDGTETSRLMMVVGTDEGGLVHPRWEENLSLALKLNAQLEKTNPGICRFLSLRQERFNQDMLPGTMLIEVGAAGDTLPQALEATRYLAEAITALAWGVKADSAN